MTLVIALGVALLFSGKLIQISFHAEKLLPHVKSGMLDVGRVALTGVMMSFCRMEIIATVHASNVK